MCNKNLLLLFINIGMKLFPPALTLFNNIISLLNDFDFKVEFTKILILNYKRLLIQSESMFGQPGKITDNIVQVLSVPVLENILEHDNIIYYLLEVYDVY